MTERTVLVTLAIGRSFAERWHARCAPNWRTYARRHGYDVVCLEEPLDASRRAAARSPAWQKCLVLGQAFAREYDRVVWVDADVLFNPSAPAITDGVPLERVGVADEYATPSREVHRLVLAKLYRHWDAIREPYVRNVTARDYYAAWGLEPRFDRVAQTGVMVLSPLHHRELLETVYRRYEDAGPGLNYEMRPLSWELIAADLATWIDPRFNYLWGHYKALNFPFLLNNPGHHDLADAVTLALHDVHALHFAGSVAEMAAARDLAPGAPVRTPVQAAARSVTRTPVALAVFARPDLTERLLAAVRSARPSRVLVFGDAPRSEAGREAERCADVRTIVEHADLGCPVETRFAETHLGADARLTTGLDWVFDRVPEAIVLEDDCIPEPSFFAFCDALLERYRDDQRVMAISGNDFAHRADEPATAYRFSRYPLIWGWATWRRAWELHDAEMADWPALRDAGWLEGLFGDPLAAAYWSHLFEQSYAHAGSWDYAWTATCLRMNGLVAHPTRNLVTNLGFREDATRTSIADGYRSPFAAVPTQPIVFPLSHPPQVVRDAVGDAFLEDVMFSGNLGRAFARLRRLRSLRDRASG